MESGSDISPCTHKKKKKGMHVCMRNVHTGMMQRGLLEACCEPCDVMGLLHSCAGCWDRHASWYGPETTKKKQKKRCVRERIGHDKTSCFVTTQTSLPREWSSLNIHFIFAGSPHSGVTVKSERGRCRGIQTARWSRLNVNGVSPLRARRWRHRRTGTRGADATFTCSRTESAPSIRRHGRAQSIYRDKAWFLFHAFYLKRLYIYLYMFTVYI